MQRELSATTRFLTLCVCGGKEEDETPMDSANSGHRHYQTFPCDGPYVKNNTMEQHLGSIFCSVNDVRQCDMPADPVGPVLSRMAVLKSADSFQLAEYSACIITSISDHNESMTILNLTDHTLNLGDFQTSDGFFKMAAMMAFFLEADGSKTSGSTSAIGWLSGYGSISDDMMSMDNNGLPGTKHLDSVAEKLLRTISRIT